MDVTRRFGASPEALPGLRAEEWNASSGSPCSPAGPKSLPSVRIPGQHPSCPVPDGRERPPAFVLRLAQLRLRLPQRAPLPLLLDPDPPVEVEHQLPRRLVGD